jgi:hypothetical protein
MRIIGASRHQGNPNCQRPRRRQRPGTRSAVFPASADKIGLLILRKLHHLVREVVVFGLRPARGKVAKLRIPLS